jgi:hypothetical protein
MPIEISRLGTPKAVSLAEFNERCESFDPIPGSQPDPNEVVKQIHYAVGGRDIENNEMVELAVNQDAPTLLVAAGFTVQGDIDSVIGITDHLAFTLAGSFYPVPRHEDSLQRDIHVPYVHRWTDDDDDEEHSVGHSLIKHSILETHSNDKH